MSQSSESTDKTVSTSKGQAPDGSATGETDPASAASTQTEMAQAFKDLARGEQQAATIEANLTNLETKLDALLASIEDRPSASTSPGQEGKEGAKDEQGPGQKK